MPKPNYIELPTGEQIPILYEDRSVLAIDKPRGWMLVPFSWQNTDRNLNAALASSIAARDFWARSRNLKYLRFVHRLDADTSGVLLLAKSPGALDTFSGLFESRRMEKVYLAVVRGLPEPREWVCTLKLAPDPKARGRMKVDPRHGKEAETHFRVLQSKANTTLVEAHPVTGRTHQIRVHLAESGHPVVGDEFYGPQPAREDVDLGLRAVSMCYVDPFVRRRVEIRAPMAEFVREYGFDIPKL
jgi:RluA family pseudouridine synthase